MARQEANGNSTLKNLIGQFTVATDPAARHALIIPLIYVWTGVENVNPASRVSRNGYGNASVTRASSPP